MSAPIAHLHELPADWTRSALLVSMARTLRAAGLETAAREAAWLLHHVTGLDRAAQIARPEATVSVAQANEALDLVARRAAGEPFQYLVGIAAFYGRDFAVNPSVLIPRPETEGLVEAALTRVSPGARILDVGTGSGCIAVTMALECEAGHVDACDIDEPALAVAAANAHRLAAAVRFFLADALAPGFSARLDPPYDVVISNPPYIPDVEGPGLQIEVLAHEPHLALFSGDDALRFHRRLARAAVEGLVTPGGWLLCELHESSGDEAAADWIAAGLEQVAVRRDLAGRDRVVEGRVPLRRAMVLGRINRAFESPDAGGAAGPFT